MFFSVLNKNAGCTCAFSNCSSVSIFSFSRLSLSFCFTHQYFTYLIIAAAAITFSGSINPKLTAGQNRVKVRFVLYSLKRESTKGKTDQYRNQAAPNMKI